MAQLHLTSGSGLQTAHDFAHHAATLLLQVRISQYNSAPHVCTAGVYRYRRVLCEHVLPVFGCAREIMYIHDAGSLIFCVLVRQVTIVGVWQDHCC